MDQSIIFWIFVVSKQKKCVLMPHWQKRFPRKQTWWLHNSLHNMTKPFFVFFVGGRGYFGSLCSRLREQHVVKLQHWLKKKNRWENDDKMTFSITGLKLSRGRSNGWEAAALHLRGDVTWQVNRAVKWPRVHERKLATQASKPKQLLHQWSKSSEGDFSGNF